MYTLHIRILSVLAGHAARTTKEPYVRVYSITLLVHEGQMTILSCSITSSIPSWVYTNGQIINLGGSSSINPVFPDKSRFSVSQRGYLEIRDTKYSDAGMYTCAYPGRGRETVELRVGPPLTTTTKAPSVISYSFTLYLHEGQTARFSCSHSDHIPMWIHPDGIIINVFDSTSLNTAFPDRQRFSVSGDGSLTIYNTRPTDAGRYICSYPGHLNETDELVVRPPLTTTTNVPSIISFSFTLYLHEGQTARFSCSHSGHIPIWIHPGGLIINMYDKTSLIPTFPDQDRFSVSSDGTLVIHNTRPTDAGRYICAYPGHLNETDELVVRPPLPTLPILSTPDSSKTTSSVHTRSTGEPTKYSIIHSSLTYKTKLHTKYQCEEDLNDFLYIILYVHEGQTAILSCTITDRIPTWISPSGEYITHYGYSFIYPALSHREKISVDQHGYLTIRNTKQYDAGKYFCSYPGRGNLTVGLVIRPPFSTRRMFSTSSATTSVSPFKATSTSMKVQAAVTRAITAHA